MSVFYQHVAFGIEQVVRQTTRLGAGTTVGATVADVLAEIALPAVADTQGTVDKELQRHGGFFPYRTDFLEAQLTAQDDLAET